PRASSVGSIVVRPSSSSARRSILVICHRNWSLSICLYSSGIRCHPCRPNSQRSSRILRSLMPVGRWRSIILELLQDIHPVSGVQNSTRNVTLLKWTTAPSHRLSSHVVLMNHRYVQGEIRVGRSSLPPGVHEAQRCHRSIVTALVGLDRCRVVRR